ncbi:hypothetical protein [Glaciimonas immobilis]|uniref:Uncharacterized protein n=1 Tax=Glaciimonas immobilis TaxID=728004 RepID=A0A840RV99_9BURK|nr:hypothetical protein [Glaciimonas immobilis]KAF3999891.1 hypothetical protein HAV38_01550 [Glaciimonas immobilis]MBB5200379.1 hypothetical protein [Glaciimonas immobilis]
MKVNHHSMAGDLLVRSIKTRMGNQSGDKLKSPNDPWAALHVRPFSRDTLVVGCGTAINLFEGEGHWGNHIGCDTLDISPLVKPDILGNIAAPQIPQECWNQYKTILLEGIPHELYNQKQVLRNLDLLRQHDSVVIFKGLAQNAAEELSTLATNLYQAGELKHKWSMTQVFDISEIPEGIIRDTEFARTLQCELRAQLASDNSFTYLTRTEGDPVALAPAGDR